MPIVSEGKKRLLGNIATNFIEVIVSGLIGIWLTRYLIQHLGVAVYGMIPLVIQVVAYFNLFSIAVRNAVGRFVAIHFSRGESEQSNIYFSTTLLSMSILCLFLCIPVIVITVLLSAIFNIPAGCEMSARWLFLLVTLSSFFTAVTSPFLVSTFVRHRFDLSNLMKILSKLLRVSIVVVCFGYFGASLEYVGWSYCAMGLFLLFSSIWLTVQLMPQLHFEWKSCRWYALREMASTGGWMTINQVGTLLYLSTDLIIINLLLGPEQCGRYGPFVLVVSLLSLFGSAVANVFTPIAYEHIAQGKEDILSHHAKRSTKFMGLIIALPIGLLCGLSVPLLRWWLGGAFSELSPLMCLLVGPWIVNITVRPLFSIYRGLNKVKVPALVIVAGGVVNVILTVLLIRYARLGLYGAALASVFCLTGKNLFFTPIYAALSLGKGKLAFFKDMVPGVLMATLVFFAGFGLSWMYELSSVWRLGVAVVGLSVVYLLVCCGVALSKEDRRFLLSLVHR